MSCCQLCHPALPVLCWSILLCIQLCNLCSLVQKCLCFLGIYFLNISFLWTSSVAIFSEGLWNLEDVLFRIWNMSCTSHSLSQFPSFVSTPSLLSEKCINWRKCKYRFHFIMLVRMECKTSLFLPISLPVSFISSVPFVLLLPETDISSRYNRLGRRSLIKNVHAPVIIS